MWIRYIRRFLKKGCPQIIHLFFSIFHEINHPAIGVPTWLRNPPCKVKPRVDTRQTFLGHLTQALRCNSTHHLPIKVHNAQLTWRRTRHPRRKKWVMWVDIYLSRQYGQMKSRAGQRQREGRVEERRSEKRKSQKKADADARKGRKVAKHCVFPVIWGSKSRLAKAAGAEPAGQARDEKLTAVVARSTFRSESVQNTPFSDHFWKLRCRKSARRCGAKHISKSKCTKHTILGPLLEVEMSKKCTPMWREAHFQVKMYKTHQVRTTFRS